MFWDSIFCPYVSFYKTIQMELTKEQAVHACFPSDDCRGIGVSFEIQVASSHLLSLISESRTIVKTIFF